MKGYEDLRVWHEAIALSKLVYAKTASFPKSEAFGLTSQIRRSAVSVASNIAEGAARNSSKEFSHFIGIALGSLAELHTQLIIANGLYIDTNTSQELINSIQQLRKMLSGLKSKLKAGNE